MEAQNKKLVWELRVKIAVDPSWVGDGFEATPERIEEHLQGLIPYAYSHEVTVKVTTLKAPPQITIKQLQGY